MQSVEQTKVGKQHQLRSSIIYLTRMGTDTIPPRTKNFDIHYQSMSLSFHLPLTRGGGRGEVPLQFHVTPSSWHCSLQARTETDLSTFYLCYRNNSQRVSEETDTILSVATSIPVQQKPRCKQATTFCPIHPTEFTKAFKSR